MREAPGGIPPRRLVSDTTRTAYRPFDGPCKRWPCHLPSTGCRRCSRDPSRRDASSLPDRPHAVRPMPSRPRLWTVPAAPPDHRQHTGRPATIWLRPHSSVLRCPWHGMPSRCPPRWPPRDGRARQREADRNQPRRDSSVVGKLQQKTRISDHSPIDGSRYQYVARTMLPSSASIVRRIGSWRQFPPAAGQASRHKIEFSASQSVGGGGLRVGWELGCRWAQSPLIRHGAGLQRMQPAFRLAGSFESPDPAVCADRRSPVSRLSFNQGNRETCRQRGGRVGKAAGSETRAEHSGRVSAGCQFECRPSRPWR